MCRVLATLLVFGLAPAWTVITDEQLERFRRDGLIIIPSVLTAVEIDAYRTALHTTLAAGGVDHHNLDGTASRLGELGHGIGGMVDIFYAPWKLRLSQHPAIFAAVSSLWNRTFARPDLHPDQLYRNPFAPFHAGAGYLYIDRISYRVPSRFMEGHELPGPRPMQTGLFPHVDCNPFVPFDQDRGAQPGMAFRWRPVQAMVALTSSYNPRTEGGMEAALGFHRRLEEHMAATREPFEAATTHTNFFALVPGKDDAIIPWLRPIEFDAGSLVLWDSRLPHRTSDVHIGAGTREMIYTGFLPYVQPNMRFAQQQLDGLRRRIEPLDLGGGGAPELIGSAELNMTRLGRKLVGELPWMSNQ